MKNQVFRIIGKRPRQLCHKLRHNWILNTQRCFWMFHRSAMKHPSVVV